MLCDHMKDDDNNNDNDDCAEELCLDDYECQQEEINRMFPNIDFTIAMTLEEIDEVVSPLDKIVVKQTFNCYCYDGESMSHAPIPKWFTIHCREDEKMTNRVIIRELANQGFSLECNHRFLEGFERSARGGECQFEPATGS